MGEDETRMPIRITTELPALARCLKAGEQLETISASDKNVLRELSRRIDRFAERQGAYWDKLE
jgi:hypothetical protein